MKQKERFSVILLFCFLLGINGSIHATDNVRWDLEKVSEWVMSQLHYPEEAEGCNAVGVEQFCLSVAWDGRVFLSARPYTICPAFEDEIKRVVNEAPRCNVIPQSAEEAYEYVVVDFYEFLPKDKRRNVKRIPHYMPPRFAAKGQKNALYAGRENFMEYIYGSLTIPESFPSGVADTIALEYTIRENGKIENVKTKGRHAELADEVGKLMEKAPRWKPAMTVDKHEISVTLRDRLIVRTDNNDGEKLPYVAYVDEVYLNSTTRPADIDMIVINPEEKAEYQGTKFLVDLSSPLKSILEEKGVNEDYGVSGSLVIEKDGSIGGVDFKSLPCFDSVGVDVKSILCSSLEKMKWKAARQGGVPVRSAYDFAFVGHKKSNNANNNRFKPDYEVFGKHIISLQADPAKIPYGSIRKDGSVTVYPFTPSGMFDTKEYYKGLFYYQKHNGKGNLSKKYWDRIYDLYVK